MSLTGTDFYGYVVGQKINEGGFGEIYQGTSPEGELVAMKFIRADVRQEDETARNRFIREIRTLQNVKHDYIVPIVTFGFKDNILYMVMPYIDGKDISEWLDDERRFTLKEVNDFVQCIAPALAVGHEQNIIHRDLKPENVITKTVDGVLHYYLIDFGLAKRPGMDTTLTMKGYKVGTPEYISPESLKSKPVSPRSDLYSLGMMAYELLIGDLPFHEDNMYDLIMAQIMTPPPVPSELNPAVPTSIEAIILKALAKEPEDRYDDCNTFAAAFQAAFDALNPEQQNKNYWV